MVGCSPRSAVALSVVAAGSLGLSGLLVGCTASGPSSAHASSAVLADYNAEGISDATETSGFGGYSISAASRTVTAYRTAAATADDLARVQGVGLPAGFSLRVKTVQRSWTTLEQLEESLPSRLPLSLKPLLSEVDIDPGANGLDVGLTSVSSSSRTALRKVLGSSLVEVFRAEKATAS